MRSIGIKKNTTCLQKKCGSVVKSFLYKILNLPHLHNHFPLLTFTLSPVLALAIASFRSQFSLYFSQLPAFLPCHNTTLDSIRLSPLPFSGNSLSSNLALQQFLSLLPFLVSNNTILDSIRPSPVPEQASQPCTA